MLRQPTFGAFVMASLPPPAKTIIVRHLMLTLMVVLLGGLAGLALSSALWP